MKTAIIYALLVMFIAVVSIALSSWACADELCILVNGQEFLKINNNNSPTKTSEGYLNPIRWHNTKQSTTEPANCAGKCHGCMREQEKPAPEKWERTFQNITAFISQVPTKPYAVSPAIPYKEWHKTLEQRY